LSEHLSARQIKDFNQRSASPSALLAAMNHIALCEACRVHVSSEVSSDQKIHSAVESLRNDLLGQTQTDHLTYEELAGTVDHALSEVDREIIESHLEICLHCAAELADLRAFKAELTTYPEIERRPAHASTLRERIIGYLRAPSYRIPIQVAAAATVVLLCVSMAMLLLRKDPADLHPEVSELQHVEAPAPPSVPPSVPVDEGTANGSQTPSQNPAEIAEAINNGRSVVAIDKDGNVTGLDSLPPAYQREVKTALKNKRVETPPEIRGLIGRTGALMGSAGGGPGFSLLGPIGTSVRAEKPTFRWKPLAGATSYVVTVYDSSFNKVASSEAQPGTEWTPVSSLKRGETYSWQVTAIKDGKEIISPAPPAPAAKFKSIDASRARELDRAKRMYADSHLVLGVLYQRAGLLDDAEREFKAVYASNPKSQIARKLLTDVKSLRQAR
jgi:hypothetical protein